MQVIVYLHLYLISILVSITCSLVLEDPFFTHLDALFVIPENFPGIHNSRGRILTRQPNPSGSQQHTGSFKISPRPPSTCIFIIVKQLQELSVESLLLTPITFTNESPFVPFDMPHFYH